MASIQVTPNEVTIEGLPALLAADACAFFTRYGKCKYSYMEDSRIAVRVTGLSEGSVTAMAPTLKQIASALKLPDPMPAGGIGTK